MSGLFLPRSVAIQRASRLQQWREDVYRSLDLEDTDPLLVEYCIRLQRFDRRLMLVRARDTVVPGLPMKPGYYHLLTDNGPAVPLTITIIEGANGEWCEPTSRIFEKLMAGDMREQRNLERFERIRREEFDANEREKARDREERRDHLRELVDAYTRTSISMNTARPWTQNNQPHSVRDAGERAKVISLDDRRGAA